MQTYSERRRVNVMKVSLKCRTARFKRKVARKLAGRRMKVSSGFSTIAAGALVVACAPAFADEPSIKVSGRVMLDFNAVEADGAALDVSSSEARNIRLGVSGALSGAIDYKAELHTDSSGEVQVTDAYLDFALAEGWELRAGQMKTPNSLDEQTSSRFISTYERGAFTDAFGFDRRLGAQVQKSGARYTLTGGVFGENVNSGSGDGGHAVAARGTYAFGLGGDDLAHIGASARYREQGDGAGLIRYRQRAFAHIPGRAVSTGPIAGSDTFVGVEGALSLSGGWAATEYGVLSADCAACAGGEAELQGYYLEAGWMFGGRRGYRGGRFDRPDVGAELGEGGFGAWSIVARADSLDQSDGGLDGGELDTFILGADWWPTTHSRLGINGFWSDVAYGTSTSGLDSAFAAQVGAGVESDDVSGIVVRLQFDF